MTFDKAAIDFHFLSIVESVPRAGAAILQKTWPDRLNDHPELESDADEQLLTYIPYVLTISYLVEIFIFCLPTPP